MQELMIWGGTHADELGPMKLVDSILEEPIPHVSANIVNHMARKLRRRLVGVNMNAAYPGNPSSEIPEERRAPNVLIESQGFDMVIDLHRTSDFAFNTAYIGTRGASGEALGFIASLGIKNLVSTTHNQLSEHIPNCFLLDLTDRHFVNMKELRDRFKCLANDESPTIARPSDFQWFKYVGSAHISQFDPKDLKIDPKSLEQVPPQIAPQIGNCHPSALWMTYTGKPNEAGYWSELCVPIETPDDSHWLNAA